MSSHHPELAAGRWHSMSLMEQLGNAGSEVSRALRARAKGHAERERSAFHRFLDLIDMTIADPRLRGRRREICRMREIVCDYFVGENSSGSTPESLDRYFLAFAVAARRQAAVARKSSPDPML